MTLYKLEFHLKITSLLEENHMIKQLFNVNIITEGPLKCTATNALDALKHTKKPKNTIKIVYYRLIFILMHIQDDYI